MDRIKTAKVRRPPALRGPGFMIDPSQPKVPQDPKSSSFPPSNPAVSNGTKNSQAGLVFGQQANASQIFNQPPSATPNGSTTLFGNTGQNAFSAQFVPPSSGFSFNAQPNVGQNPFSPSNIDPLGGPTAGGLAGYQGTIFSIPAIAPSYGDSFLKPQENPPVVEVTPFKFNDSKDPAGTQTGAAVFGTNASTGFSSSNTSSVQQNSLEATVNTFGQPKPPTPLFNQSSTFTPQPVSQQPTSHIFGHLGAQQGPESANFIGSNKPIPTESQYSNSFIIQKEDIMSTSPDNSPQPKGLGNSTPFGYPNVHTQSSANSVPDGFSRIPQPVAETVASPATGQDSIQKDNQADHLQNDLPKAPLFGIPPALADEKSRSTEPSPTKSSRQIQAPNLSEPVLKDAKPATTNFFGGIKVPTSFSTSETVVPSSFTTPNTPHSSRAVGFEKRDQSSASIVTDRLALGESTHGSIVSNFDWYKPPTPPKEFTEEQKRQLLIGYQLKCLDAGIHEYLATSAQVNNKSVDPTSFYMKCKQEILDGKGFAVARVAGSKRKMMNSQHDDGVNHKKARLGTSASNSSSIQHANITNGGLSSTSLSATPVFTQPAPGAPVLTPAQPVKSLFAQHAPGAPVLSPIQQAKSLFTQPLPGATVLTPLQQAKSLFIQAAPVVTPGQQAMGAKRKASEDPDRNKAEGATNSAKRARADDSISYPSLSSSTSSQTSSLFKNILSNKEQGSSPSAGERNAPKTKSSWETPRFEGNSTNPSTAASSIQVQPPNVVSEGTFQSSLTGVTGGSSPQPPPKSKPTSSVSQPSSSTSTGSNPFSNLLTVSNTPGLSKTFEQSSSTSKISSSSSDLPATSNNSFLNKASEKSSSTSKISNPFSDLPTTSNNPFSNKVSQPLPSTATSVAPVSNKPNTTKTAPSAIAKTPSIVPPKFGAPVNFLSQFGKAAEETAKKEKAVRKAEDFDSDDDEAEWERKDAEKQQAKKQMVEEAAKAAATFMPVLGPTSSGSKSEKKEPKSFQPFESIPRSATAPTPATSGASVLTEPQQKLENSQNIFGHLSDTESGADGSKTGDADDEDEDTGSEEIAEQGDPRKDAKDKIAITSAPQLHAVKNNPFGSEQLQPDPAANNPFAASSALFTKNLAEKADQSEPTGGLFDRITKDADGKPIRETSSAENAEDPVTPTASPIASNIFGKLSQGTGSRIFNKSPLGGGAFGQLSQLSGPSAATVPASTPITSVFGKTSSAASFSGGFGSSNSPTSDNTWKVDTPIKFASSDSPPQVKVTSPSPSKPALGGLFGSPPSNSSTEPSAKASPAFFSTTPAKDPTVGFGFAFGGPPKFGTTSLAPPSDNIFNVTSRATSPGATTGGESANDSNADGADAESMKDDQLNLTATGPGEEDEDVLFTVKAKAMTYDAENKSWPSKGIGMLRVLKHHDNGKTRILLRQDPSGKIVLNAALLETLNYEYVPSKSVKMAVATDAGRLATWMIRTGKDEDARELAKILESEKSN